jgi:hypothetical protein
MNSIEKSRLWVSLLVMILTAAVVFTGCDLGSSSSSKSVRSATVKAVVAVTTPAGAAASSFQPSEVGCAGDTVGAANGDRVSFTPTSMKIRMLGMYLAEVGAYDADAGGVVGVPGTREIAVFAHNTATNIELVGQTAFSALYEQEATVGQDDFGDYENIKVLYGENMVGGGIDESNVYISGSVCVGSTAVSFTDLKLPMGSTGIALNMPRKVAVSDAAEAVVQVLFDVQNYPYFIRHAGDPYYPLVKIPNTTDIYVVGGNPPFLPYAAAGDPQVEHYKVTLTDPSFGLVDKWYLKLLAFKDEAGALVAVQWYPVFEAGFTLTGEQNAFDPGMLYMAELISTVANIYSIKNADTMTAVPERNLQFSAFTLGDHTGTLKYADTDYAYSAQKL